MPLTFLAHQAPLLPLTRRANRWIDPLTLVIGSMAPDLAYALDGAGGIHVSAHRFPGLLTFCVPATVVVCWIVVRVLAPVVPDHLPRNTVFAFADYRGLRAHRFRLVPSVVGALLGAVSHSFLDEFTHGFGWVARHWDWYRQPITDARWLGKVWAPFEVAQFSGHVFLSAWCVWLLARYGRQGWFAVQASAVPPFPVSKRSTATLWGVIVAGSAVGLLLVVTHRRDEATDIVRAVGFVFLAMTVGAAVLLASSRQPGAGRSDRSEGSQVP